ncbi:PIG-L family deacetylase [Curtobacterium sp. MCSS17_015]|uniref:PIG-L family deacetylase n=1 Tax=Curtobacterium sp. MCSS17_015 TaxID=2175666 RepID=UPI000DA822D3|nr:PIG-L family deacetylase [Curtobacterium sp. MCSS17_015]WIB27271.1 PIG-L family deacetylase [Curtobacterium sp. MCSS17_015]
MSTAPTTRPERVLFVHAHPDDETLSSGGTIATLLELGAHVTVLTATRGERGEMLTAELAPLAGDGRRVAAHRETEIAAALAALGGPAHLWLGGPGARPTDLPERRYTDSGMQWGPDGRATAAGDAPADSLTRADLGEVVDDIRAAIRSTGADAVVSYADDGGYGHPDHLRVHAAARYAARAEEVAFSMIVDADSGLADATVDVLPVRGKVRAALEQYRSQITVDPADPSEPGRLSYVMPHGVRQAVPAQEGFRHDQAPVPTAPQTFVEMSGPGRAAAVVVTAAVGLLVGGLGTITHQQTVALGSWSAAPIGMVLTALIVIGVVVGVRLLYRSRLLVAAVGIGIILATQVLVAVAGSSSPLVLANTAGYVWTFGPAVVAMLVLAWPDLSGLRVRPAPEAARSEVAAPHG